MTYVKQEWKNKPNETTPYSAGRMEHMEDGIYDNSVKSENTEKIIGTNNNNFSEAQTYKVKDIVIYQNELWKCHTAIVTPGLWTGETNWEEISIIDPSTTKINRDLIPQFKKLDFTLSSGITADATYTTELIFNEITREVKLFFGVNGTFAATVYTNLLTFDSQYAPEKEVMNNAYAAVNNNIAVRVNADGLARIYGGDTTQTVARGQISWIAKGN